MVDARENWETLYQIMCDHPDYLVFYYWYQTTSTVDHYETPVYDEDGNFIYHAYTYTETITEDHKGWTTDPNFEHNTGEVRLMHTKYYLSNVTVDKSGNYRFARSPYVDDFREIMDEYPYYAEVQLNKYDRSGTTLIHYPIPGKFPKDKLSSLTPSDFQYLCGHPDLTRTGPDLEVKGK